MTTTRKPSAAQRIEDLENTVLRLEGLSVGLHGELAEAQTDLYVVENNLRLVAAVTILLLLVVFIVGTAWITKHV